MHEMRAVRKMRFARHAWRVCDACDMCNEMYKIWHEMMQNVTWNDVRYACMQCRSFILVTYNEMQPWIFDFGYMQRDVTLNFWLLIVDCNLILLFLISLRIWSIGVDVKLTQQDVKNSRLQIAPPYHPFCKGAKWNEWEQRAEMKWNEWTDKCMVRL